MAPVPLPKPKETVSPDPDSFPCTTGIFITCSSGYRKIQRPWKSGGLDEWRFSGLMPPMGFVMLWYKGRRQARSQLRLRGSWPRLSFLQAVSVLILALILLPRTDKPRINISNSYVGGSSEFAWSSFGRLCLGYQTGPPQLPRSGKSGFRSYAMFLPYGSYHGISYPLVVAATLHVHLTCLYAGFPSFSLQTPEVQQETLQSVTHLHLAVSPNNAQTILDKYHQNLLIIPMTSWQF